MVAVERCYFQDAFGSSGIACDPFGVFGGAGGACRAGGVSLHAAACER